MKPYVFSRSGNWIMRYRETVNESGTLRTIQRAKILCSTKEADKDRARKLAKAEIEKLESYRPADPRLIVTLGDFFTNVSLPFVRTNRRAATAQGYSDIWESHCAGRKDISGALLKDVETRHVYSWLCQIAATHRNRKGELLKNLTLQHIKAFLSGVFKLAKNHGCIRGENPVRDATVPPARDGAETYAYSVEEISSMLAVLPEPARTMVATAAFTGLRRSELQGLVWEAYGNGELRVLRAS